MYIVKMPTSVPTAALDILVRTPGSQAAPVVAGGDGAYYEVRARALVVPTPVGSPGYVPRFRLGLSLALVPVGAQPFAIGPGAQLSASLALLSSTDVGPTINVAAFPDPAGGPAIRLVGGTAGELSTAGTIYIVSLILSTARDEDRLTGI